MPPKIYVCTGKYCPRGERTLAQLKEYGFAAEQGACTTLCTTGDRNNLYLTTDTQDGFHSLNDEPISDLIQRLGKMKE